MEGDRFEIRLSGSGGQGIILAAIVLAETAWVQEGLHVCQTQSYGPEARGGSSKAEVVISRSEIDYPKAIRPDLLLAMTQEACDAYFNDLKPEGLLVIDSGIVKQIPTDRVAAIPITKIARETTGKTLTSNMVALGAVARLTGVISLKKLEATLKKRSPGGFEEDNLRALRAGVRAGKKVPLDSLPPSVFPDDEEED